MSFDAGSAAAKYILDISDVETKAAQLKALFAGIKQEAAGLGGAGGSPATRASSFAAETRAQAALTAQQARLARAQGDGARAARLEAEAQQTLTAALVRSDTTTAQAIGLQRQLASVQLQATRGTQQTTGALGGLRGALGGVGVAFVAQQLVALGQAAGQDALQLRETQNSLRAVAGSAQVYSQIISEARRQQLLFGGSLQENIEGLQGLAVTSRSTGAQLNTLLDLQKRLTLLDPAQGAEGARIALNEALSGNIASLSRRFEIPRDMIRALGDESKPVAERLKVLDAFLNRVGITSESVASRVDQDALAFRRLNQELEDTRLNAGGELASAFSGAATGLSRLVGLINENPRAIAELQALLNGRQGQTPTVTDADVARVQREQAAQRIDPQLQRATEALAFRTANTRGVIGSIFGGSEEFDRQKAALLGVRDAMVDLSAASEQGRAQAQLLLDQFEQRRITLPQLIALTQAYADREREGAGIEDFRTRAVRVATESTQESATQSLVDAANKQRQAAQIDLVKAKAQAAADAFLRLHPQITASGVASLEAAGKIDPLLSQLIQAQLRANAATDALASFNAQQGLAARGARPPTNLTEARLPGGGAGTRLIGQLGAGAGTDAQRALTEQNRIRQAQNQLDLTRAKTSAQRIAILQRELSITTDQAERLRIQAQIEGERNSAAKAHNTTLDKTLSLNERIRDSLESQLKAQIDVRKQAAQDTLDRLKEDQELAQARRVLANSHDERFRQAAQARIDLIGADRDERALQLRQAQATAGGTIVNGRVFQSIPNAPGNQTPSLPSTGQAQAASTAPGLPQAQGGGVQVLVFVDGEQIAARTEVRVINTLRTGRQQAVSGGV